MNSEITSAASSATDGKTVVFYVGTYSTEDRCGVYPLNYDPVQDTWTLGNPDRSIENLSYAAFDAARNLYYLLNEKSGEISVASWSQAAGWRQTETLSSFGTEPCFVEMDSVSRLLAIANYGSGHVVTFALERDTGNPGKPITVYDNYGRGPVAERQDGPHAHCVRFRGCWLYSTDLGTDSVLARRVDTASDEEAVAITAFQAPPGEGPRHILFHPEKPIAYLLSELGSKIFILRERADGLLEEIEVWPTLPDGFQGESLGGHLALNAAGDSLYVSNRGHDSLAVFAIADDGRLRSIQNVPSGGVSPRFFLLAEGICRVLVAHQDGNSVVVYGLNADGTIGDIKASFGVPQAAFIGRLISCA